MTIKVVSDGFLINKNIVNAAHFKSGDKVEIIVTEGSIFVTKANEAQISTDIVKDFQLISEYTLKDIWDNDADKVWDEWYAQNKDRLS